MPRLYVLGGPDVGRAFDVEESAVLGRSPDCDVTLRDRSVSRRHARLEREGDRWFVVDLGARNGVRLAGERVERAALADGDEILLGELALRIRLAHAAAEEGAAAAPASPASPAEHDLGDEIVLEEDGVEARLGPTAFTPRAAAGVFPPRSATDAPAVRPRGGGVGVGGSGEAASEAASQATGEAAGTPGTPGTPATPATPATPGPASAAARPAPELTPRERRREEILSSIARSRNPGLLGGDLAQWPLWARALIGLLAVAVLVGALYGSFALVRMLRGTL